MYGYLKRLATTGAAYQASSLLSGFFGVFTLPLYTHHLAPSAYGYAETLLTFIILTSIVLRLGIGEAFVRFWFDDEDRERRDRLARTTTGWVLATTSAAAIAGVFFAGPLSVALLRHRDAVLMGYGVLGLWAFTNLEIGYALLRVEERKRAYLTVSCANVVLTVLLTVLLVVVGGYGARGYVLGNYAASTLVLLGLWADLAGRRRLGLPRRDRVLRGMVAFGSPTVPADAAVFALNVIDRAWLLRADSPRAAGLYSVSIKLATVVVVAVRGFQAAWPPLAYSVSDEREARRLYAFVTTYYCLATGLVVAALTLLGRWLVRLLAAGSYFPAHRALPWVALGWALYGLFLVFVTIAGRAKVTTRTFPAAVAGLAINVGGLALLIGPLGIVGAGISLCAAYLVMLVAVHLLTRRLFVVPFEWGRLALLVAVLAGVSVGGELLLPTHGVAGFVTRLVALGLIPALLLALRFFRPEETRRVTTLLRRRADSPAAAG
ncbi:MAG TPA: lipopolysaccharide biosynthesis protein [Solirubrobacteraceae bacterium]|nr:lipopolysaccharide biosynthesis protein [Solirubrobacteraceae bacterium]